jgi:hypothetical protein
VLVSPAAALVSPAAALVSPAAALVSLAAALGKIYNVASPASGFSWAREGCRAGFEPGALIVSNLIATPHPGDLCRGMIYNQ